MARCIKKAGFQLHFDDKWTPLLTKLLPTEIVRTDDLTIGRSAMPGENGMVKVSNALRSRLRSNEHETEDRGYIERCFGRSIYSPDKLARIEQQLAPATTWVPPVVHKGRERVGPTHQRGHAAPLRAG